VAPSSLSSTLKGHYRLHPQRAFEKLQEFILQLIDLVDMEYPECQELVRKTKDRLFDKRNQ
jgi:hypothetical protein